MIRGLKPAAVSAFCAHAKDHGYWRPYDITNDDRRVWMVKVKKRLGFLQEFDKAKLKNSLKRAGAKEEHATKVADKVEDKVREGTSTVEIWEWCITELRPLDAKAAKA